MGRGWVIIYSIAQLFWSPYLLGNIEILKRFALWVCLKNWTCSGTTCTLRLVFLLLQIGALMFGYTTCIRL